MNESYRIDLPEPGDKLQIHLQGVKINGRGGVELDPLKALTYEIDIGEILKDRIDDDTLYLNTFISVKKKPIFVLIECPGCGKENELDSNLGTNHYLVCECETSYNKIQETTE